MSAPLSEHRADNPIGVFDSGLGGLTVLSAIHNHLPRENLVYFGDTARVPYGSKSRETVIRYSLEILDFLLEKQVKVVVVACNTASSHALEELKKRSPVPVIGVVEPGVEALLQRNPGSRAAVIATRSTVRSGAYEKELARRNSEIYLYSKACPLFVPLVEEGFANKSVTDLVIRDYLDEIAREDIRQVILGCTHYPLLKKSIQRLYPQFELIDSSVETARSLAGLLSADHLLSERQENGSIELVVSDITDSLQDMEILFFGQTVHRVEKVMLGW